MTYQPIAALLTVLRPRYPLLTARDLQELVYQNAVPFQLMHGNGTRQSHYLLDAKAVRKWARQNYPALAERRRQIREMRLHGDRIRESYAND